MVLMGPGWGSAGDVNEDAPGLLGAISIKTLRDAGFNVLTWDPRGFGESTGSVEIDSVDYEARDVQQLLDWVATQPQVALDSNGDPRSGMVGALVRRRHPVRHRGRRLPRRCAVPIIAWNSLETSLFKAQTPKTGWGNLLATAATLQGASLDPHIAAANQSANTTGTFDPADVEWFAERGPGRARVRGQRPDAGDPRHRRHALHAPGSRHQLRAAAGRRRADRPCSGSAAATASASPIRETKHRVSEAAVAWLDRYVNLDDSADIGSPFEFIDQNGVTYTSDGFPEPDGEPITATGSGTLQLVEDGGAGPATGGEAAGGLRNVRAADHPGARHQRGRGHHSCAGSGGARRRRADAAAHLLGHRSRQRPPDAVFAQLVDDTTGLVLGNQITPIEVVLDGASHTIDVPLEMVAQHIEPGTSLTLQLVATTVAYATPQLGGTVTFDDITISLPVVTTPVVATT